LSPVGSLRTYLPLALLASILCAGAAGCSGAGDGSIAVQLVYPSPPGPAAASRASVLAPSYATDPADRIRIRVLAPHFAPVEKWFRRSDGRGEIGGIPPGTRIAVEVDEYDNTAIPSGDAVLAMAWSGDMVQALVDKPSLRFRIADEGGMLWTDNSLIPKGAAHKGTAEMLLDFFYIPENAAAVEAYVNYICPVDGAAEAMIAIDPEIAKNPLIFPPEDILARLHIFGGLSEADEAYFNEQFAKILGVG